MKRSALLLALVLAATPARADWLGDLFGAAGSWAATTRGNLATIAARYVGRGNVTGFKGPWCRNFVNYVADEAGVPLANRSNLAIDALRLGPHVREPAIGDIAVLRRRGGYHVTFFAGRQGDKIIGLGGNQHKRVRYSAYSARNVVGFVRLGR